MLIMLRSILALVLTSLALGQPMAANLAIASAEPATTQDRTGNPPPSAAQMKTIGIIGGITWVSSIEYYRVINQLVQKKLGGVSSAKILMYSIEFGEFSKEEKLAEQGDFTALNQTMVAAAMRLKRGNADFVVIASNTMNSSAKLIEREVGIPVLQIADAVGKEIQRSGVKRVVLLGTKYTMEAPFYRDFLENNFGLEIFTPDAADRDFINNVIFDELAAEQFLPASKQRFIRITEDLIRKTGATGVILGCTEIPLLINQKDLSVRVFDTIQIHSEAAVNRALGITN
ncbi:MAG: amino acid racemase [Burkholderiales bacterium]